MVDDILGPEGEDSEGTIVPGSGAEGEAGGMPPAVAGEGEVTYEDLAKKKNWKDYNSAAKSYSSLESEYGRLRDDHAKLREFSLEAYNALVEAEKKKSEGVGDNGGVKTPDKLKEMMESNPDVVEIIKDMLGNEVKPLRASVAKAQLDTALMEMKQDKEHFPYLDKAIEEKMTTIFRANQALPATKETLYLLYQAAVGFSASAISEKAKTKGMEEAYKTIGQKTKTFSEGEGGSEGGKPSTEDDKLVDSIINAGGNTLI